MRCQQCDFYKWRSKTGGMDVREATRLFVSCGRGVRKRPNLVTTTVYFGAKLIAQPHRLLNRLGWDIRDAQDTRYKAVSEI